MKKIFVLLTLISCAAIGSAKDVSSIYPYPKAGWNKPGQFVIGPATKLVLPDSPTSADLIAIDAFQAAIQKRVGYALATTTPSMYSGGAGIVLGTTGFSLARKHMQIVTPPGETTPGAEGYVLDITPEEIVIIGADSNGTNNAVTSLAQLMTVSGNTIIVPGAHVWDYPDYSARWVFSGHNLLVSSQLAAVENILDTMSLYKLNGLQQNDFKYSILQLMFSTYFQNVDSLRSHLQKQNIEIIPGVIGLGWSSGILYNDPNLAEGLPASATYIMESDTGRLLPNPNTVITNGDFESVTNNMFTGWNSGGSFYDGPNISSFVDHTVFHGGTTSARCTNFSQGNAGGNCRFEKLVQCDSNKSYSLSAWVKTQNLQGGYVQMLALGGVSGQALTFTQLSIPSTTDWTRVEVNFNSLGNTSVRLYIGVWGGGSGTIWFDDFSIHESGLCNVLRRQGTPVSVTNKTTVHHYVEGVDYQTIVDQSVDAHKDSYFPYHTPPTFKRIVSGAIKNGDTVIVSYYHPFAAISDNTGNGSVMACVSEDTLYKILADQITRVNNLYQPQKFFMGHDEIRNMNHDKACLDLQESPSQLLSENMTRCHDLIRSVSPNAEVLMWSDMVDSLHNAHNNYYLINGDLTGDWYRIPKDITIVNWNGGLATSSLQFFEKLGFSQISSPYYDVGNTSTIRAWRVAQNGIANVKGMMYTTWANDYNFLRPFAYYAWGAGPNIVHTPLDTSVLGTSHILVSASVLSDPFDSTVTISSVTMTIVDSNGTVLKSYPLASSGKNLYSVTLSDPYPSGFRYSITAVNSEGIKRTLPTYVVEKSVGNSAVSRPGEFSLALSNHPNPFNEETSIEFSISQPGFVALKLFDLLGRNIRVLSSEHFDGGRHSIRFDSEGVPAGSYVLELSSSEGVLTKQIRIVR